MELFPFQKQGVEFLATHRLALLADEMGLGKTPQAIVGSDRVNAKRLLIVCPAVARVNWGREIERWSSSKRPLDILLSLSDEPSTSNHSVICGYEYLTKNSQKLIQSGRFSRLIIDEVHFLKSTEAKRTKAVFGGMGIARHVDGVWALSGTPAPNHAGELWLLLYAFNITKLAQSQFIARYCDVVLTPYGIKVVGTKKQSIPELRGLLSKVMLRRRVDEVLPDMPPIFFHEPMVVEPGKVEGLGAELKLVLEQQSADVLAVLNRGSLTDEEKLRLLEGLAQSVSTLRRYTGLQLVEPAVDLISGELIAGLLSKIVVFAVHREVISRLEKALMAKNIKCVVVNGDVSPTQKQKNIDAFQNDRSVSVFIGNIQSAGPSITLTASHHIVFIELDWTPGNNAQAAMRCRRIGQKRSVSVRFLTVCNPVSERVTRAVKKKTKELAEIFDD